MKYEYVNCPVCRGYTLESQWCGYCNKTGMIKKLVTCGGSDG